MGISDSSRRSLTLSPSSTMESLTPSSLSWPSLEGSFTPWTEEPAEVGRKVSVFCRFFEWKFSSMQVLDIVSGHPDRIDGWCGYYMSV